SSVNCDTLLQSAPKLRAGGLALDTIAAPASWSGYSVAERDRRWNAVRAEARAAGLDCIFLPVCLDGRNFPPSQDQVGGGRSDSRYLTQIEGAAMVMPMD